MTEKQLWVPHPGMKARRQNCEVWIATIQISSGMAKMEQASVLDIKKQSSVIVYGSFEDERHIAAERIIICHHVNS